jgi:hypothetical protein
MTVPRIWSRRKERAFISEPWLVKIDLLARAYGDWITSR